MYIHQHRALMETFQMNYYNGGQILEQFTESDMTVSKFLYHDGSEIAKQHSSASKFYRYPVVVYDCTTMEQCLAYMNTNRRIIFEEH